MYSMKVHKWIFLSRKIKTSFAVNQSYHTNLWSQVNKKDVNNLIQRYVFAKQPLEPRYSIEVMGLVQKSEANGGR